MLNGKLSTNDNKLSMEKVSHKDNNLRVANRANGSILTFKLLQNIE